MLSRWVRGVLSFAALVGLLVGVPAALLLLGGDPRPSSWSGADLLAALLRPDDGTVLIGLVTLVGWAAWLVFAVSVLVELVNLVGRRRHEVRLPGLGGVQRWSAGLMLAVLALGAGSQLTSGGSVATAPARVAPLDPSPAEEAQARPTPDDAPIPGDDAGASVVLAGAPSGSRDRVHVVERGDDLWSLASRYYGQGREWRRIAAANPAQLSGGPDRLSVGWRLVIPHAAKQDAGPGDADLMRVRPGDNLTSIAERELGSAERWPQVYRANRHQLDDPDEVPVGITLAVPRVEREQAKPAPPDEPASPAPEAEPDTPAAGGTPLEPTSPVDPASTAAPSTPTPATPSPTSGPTSVPTQAAPTAAQEPVVVPAGDSSADPQADDTAAVPFGLGAVGSLLAAGLLAGLRWRRRVQLQVRPVGRRIASPAAALAPVEVELGRRARPLTLRTLDQASRAIAAHCREHDLALPALELALVGDQAIELVLREAEPDAPVCFRVEGRSWILEQADTPYLSSVPGVAEAPRPWPTLVSLGTDEHGRQVLADLEALGLLGVTGPESQTSGSLAAMAVELSFSPWAEDLTLTLLGDGSGLPAALGQHNVTHCDDADALLDRLEHRATEQRAHGSGAAPGRHRLDLDVADAWIPEVVLVQRVLTPVQLQRLTRLVTDRPRVTMAAVVQSLPGSPWTLELADDGPATLAPAGLSLEPQALPVQAVGAVVQLVSATGSTETEPAPWWQAREEEPPERSDNVTYLGRRFADTEDGDERDDEDERRTAVQLRLAETGSGAVRHPTLQLLGPVELLGAAGPPPPRAAKQCLEYCAWLLENPGTTAQAMAAALVVAEGTRRSNMSRLRSWLGTDETGRPYLPDAYTGRIRLDSCVSSDWEQLQTLLDPGVNQTATPSLELALTLVRGAPLADAAPGQWHWAEELRTDLISCIRDIGVELTGRALTSGDIDLARWAAARALVAAPGDELLLAARVRTEHRAGNVAETERLSLQLAQQARVLGVDLDPATVTLLQEVMEGRIRARFA